MFAAELPLTTPTPSRANARLLVRMPLSVMVGRRSCPVQSEVVWAGGLVVRCDLPIPVRQLVKVQVPVPPDGEVIVLNAMVESIRAGAHGVVPALTLSLYGNGGPPVEKWNALIADVRTRFPDSTSHPFVTDAITRETPDAVHRRHVRFLATFEVRVSSIDELMTLVTRDLSRGGMFLPTRRACAVGDELQVELLHPTTHEAFPVRCVVRRRVANGDSSGLGVEFVGLDAERQKALWEFVSSGLPDMDVDLVEDS